jgi:CheY-like chemotaxis protein
MDKKNASRFNILVVEDDEMLREVIADEFHSEGFNVFSADNGNKAFAIVEAERIDLIVSDMRMPGGNGMELLERVRARDPRIPVVIFVTGYAGFSEEECLAKGASKMFDKPFNRKALISYVRESLLKSCA